MRRRGHRSRWEFYIIQHKTKKREIYNVTVFYCMHRYVGTHRGCILQSIYIHMIKPRIWILYVGTYARSHIRIYSHYSLSVVKWCFPDGYGWSQAYKYWCIYSVSTRSNTFSIPKHNIIALYLLYSVNSYYRLDIFIINYNKHAVSKSLLLCIYNTYDNRTRKSEDIK